MKSSSHRLPSTSMRGPLSSSCVDVCGGVGASNPALKPLPRSQQQNSTDEEKSSNNILRIVSKQNQRCRSAYGYMPLLDTNAPHSNSTAEESRHDCGEQVLAIKTMTPCLGTKPEGHAVLDCTRLLYGPSYLVRTYKY